VRPGCGAREPAAADIAADIAAAIDWPAPTAAGVATRQGDSLMRSAKRTTHCKPPHEAGEAILRIIGALPSGPTLHPGRGERARTTSERERRIGSGESRQAVAMGKATYSAFGGSA
jgi:hypothetical protein